MRRTSSTRRRSATEPAVTLTYDPVRPAATPQLPGCAGRRRRSSAWSGVPGPRTGAGPLPDAARLGPAGQPWTSSTLNLVDARRLPRCALTTTEFFTPPARRRRGRRAPRAAGGRVPARTCETGSSTRSVLSTVGAEFPDAPELVAALLTEPELVADRQWPEEALLAAYRAAGDRGVTEHHRRSTSRPPASTRTWRWPPPGSYTLLRLLRHGRAPSSICASTT